MSTSVYTVGQPFSGLTLEQIERLDMLAEECAEVIQIVGKIKRHGYDSYHPHDLEKTPNRLLLKREILDVVAVVSAMGAKKDFPIFDSEGFYSKEAQEIWDRKLHWTHHQGKTE